MNRAAATGLVGAAAGAGVLAPSSGVLHALIHDRAGDTLADGLPLAAADIDVLRLGAGAADGVADVFVACLRNHRASRVALVAPARLRDRFADGVADVAVAGLIARLADVVALVAPARLHAGDADGVALVAVAGLIARHANRASLIAPAGLSHWAADGVALVAIAGFVAGPRAADGNLLALLIVDRLVADFFATVPHDFLDRLVASRALLLSLAEIATRSAGGSRAAVVAGRSTVSGLSDLRPRQEQEQHARHDVRLAFHRRHSSDRVWCSIVMAVRPVGQCPHRGLTRVLLTRRHRPSALGR